MERGANLSGRNAARIFIHRDQREGLAAMGPNLAKELRWDQAVTLVGERLEQRVTSEVGEEEQGRVEPGARGSSVGVLGEEANPLASA